MLKLTASREYRITDSSHCPDSSGSLKCPLRTTSLFLIASSNSLLIGSNVGVCISPAVSLCSFSLACIFSSGLSKLPIPIAHHSARSITTQNCCSRSKSGTRLVRRRTRNSSSSRGIPEVCTSLGLAQACHRIDVSCLGLGWGNAIQEHLLNAYLAYRSGRRWATFHALQSDTTLIFATG